MTIFNFFKNQFWKPTIKFLPRSLNHIFVGRSVNNILFWLALIATIVFWVINAETVQPAVNKIREVPESLFFTEYYNSSNSTIQIFIILSFLSLLFSLIKFVLFILYYTYYKFKPITVEESLSVERDIFSDNKEFAQTKERLNYINYKNNKKTKSSTNKQQKPIKNNSNKPTNKGSSLKKLK